MSLDVTLGMVSLIDPDSLKRDVDLSQISRWRIGGTAKAVYEPASTESLTKVLSALSGSGVPTPVVGDTSNILFDSTGLDGMLIKIGESFSDVRTVARRLWLGAGVSARMAADEAQRQSLSGIEHIVGIPGTIGGLVAMNGGTMRKGIGDNVVEVHAVNGVGDYIVLTEKECNFSYRGSIFQDGELIVLGALLELTEGDADSIAGTHREILNSRKGRFPLQLPNCGSTFASDPAAYAAYGSPGQMLEKVGLKGYRNGDAQFSEQHANFIVNLGNAKSHEVLNLIKTARNKVLKDLNHALRSEVRYIGAEGENVPAHQAAEML